MTTVTYRNGEEPWAACKQRHRDLSRPKNAATGAAFEVTHEDVSRGLCMFDLTCFVVLDQVSLSLPKHSPPKGIRLRGSWGVILDQCVTHGRISSFWPVSESACYLPRLNYLSID